MNTIMPNWFRRKSPAPIEAVRDFVDTIEMINALLSKESAEQQSRLGSMGASDAHRVANTARISA